MRAGWWTELGGGLVRVAMVGMGSRGDAQPMALLGAELTARGYDVEVALASDLAWIGTALGLRTTDLGFSARDFLDSEQGRTWLAAGDVASYVRWLLAFKQEIAEELQARLVRLTDGADVVVSGTATELECAVIAEARGVPYVAVHHVPLRSNSAFPHLLVSTEILSPEQNRQTYLDVDRANWPVFEPLLNAFRGQLGLPPTADNTATRLERADSLELQAYSRFLLPELADWSPRRPLTGFITPTESQRAVLSGARGDRDLDAWLAAGDPPVYFGFGSMPVLDPPAALTLIEKVSATLGVRALVGLRGATSSNPAVRVVWELDHEAVLPRCRAAVHHGGAGTTAVSLRAGLPTVVCAVFADQPFWGALLHRRDLGSTLPFTGLAELPLLAALEPLLTSQARARAAAMSQQLHSENGSAQAADAFEHALGE